MAMTVISSLFRRLLRLAASYNDTLYLTTASNELMRCCQSFVDKDAGIWFFWGLIQYPTSTVHLCSETPPSLYNRQMYLVYHQGEKCKKPL